MIQEMRYEFKPSLLQKIVRLIAEHFGVGNEIRKEHNELLANHLRLASNSKGLDKQVRATLKFVAIRIEQDSFLPFYVESYSFDNEIQNKVNLIASELNNDNQNRQYE